MDITVVEPGAGGGAGEDQAPGVSLPATAPIAGEGEVYMCPTW